MTGSRTWEDPRLHLRTLHLDGYRWATAAELRSERERRVHLARAIRNGDQPFLVADVYGPTRPGDEANDAEMWRAFLEADGHDGLLAFANTWGLPAGFELVRTSRSVAVPWPTLKRAHETFKTATRLLAAHDAGALADVVRFDRSDRAWEALVWIEGWGFDWSPVPADLVSGARPDSDDTGEVALRIATAIATNQLTELIYRHTRNVLVAGAGDARPRIQRLSDPIGGMALYMAQQLEAGKQLTRCELDTCRRFFYRDSRSDPRFCRKCHGNSASNERRRQLATDEARP